MVLVRVVLPQLTPTIRSSLAIGLAVSLGELGATMVVYPPGFVTAPVKILGEVERGYYLPAAALSVVMLAASLAALLAIAGANRHGKVGPQGRRQRKMISTRRFCGSRTPCAVGTSGLLSP